MGNFSFQRSERMFPTTFWVSSLVSGTPTAGSGKNFGVGERSSPLPLQERRHGGEKKRKLFFRGGLPKGT